MAPARLAKKDAAGSGPLDSFEAPEVQKPGGGERNPAKETPQIPSLGPHNFDCADPSSKFTLHATWLNPTNERIPLYLFRYKENEAMGEKNEGSQICDSPKWNRYP